MAQTINVLVDAGKASAGPPLGPALGPTGVNVGQVVAQINEKTKNFAGMKVPVTVIIDTATRSFEIKTGSPPVSQLIMKEIGAAKLSSNPKFDKVGNLAIEQVIKIANSKIDSLNCLSMKSAVKTVIGTCVSVGVLVEGMEPKEAIKAVNAGKFDKEIEAKKTEVSQEKKALMVEQLAAVKSKLQKELKELEAEKVKPEEAKVEAEGAAPKEGEKKEEKKGEKKEEKKEEKKGEKAKDKK